jgi:hypothetical protein
MTKLARIRSLSAADLRVLGEAALAVVGIRLALWLVEFGRLRRALDKIATNGRVEASEHPTSVQKIVWAVRVISGRIPRATCLTQALATRLMLERRAMPATLRFGVARSPERSVEAHAWLEVRGEVVIGEAETGRYRTLDPS